MRRSVMGGDFVSSGGADGFDVVIVGAGVIGAAIAAAVADGRRSVLVVERARAEASGITSRNSGVIHSGLYYPPGSLKARACIRGQELLYAWCRAHAVAHAALGKLVIARGAAELAALEALAANASRSGAQGLELVDGAAALALEPALPRPDAALRCDRTGIVDPHGLTRSLRGAAERAGAVFAMGTEVTGLRAVAAGIEVASGGEAIVAGLLINAAGLEADRLAATIGVDRFPIYPCRGDYFRLSGARGRFSRLIYPVRAQGSAGLGVHLTLELDGGVRLGPDAEYVDDRDDLRPRPDKRAAFHRAAQRLLGPIDPARLRYDSCGIRPKLRPPSEAEERDFVILEEPAGCVHLLGVESPGLTAALALAEEVAGRLR
ncbi:MAG: FAD-dependent oxidoreductase [Nannocystaceae bacterium]